MFFLKKWPNGLGYLMANTLSPSHDTKYPLQLQERISYTWALL